MCTFAVTILLIQLSYFALYLLILNLGPAGRAPCVVDVDVTQAQRGGANVLQRSS